TSLDREVVDENDRLLESVRHTTILYVNLLLYVSPTLTKTRQSPGRSTLGSAGASSSQYSASRCGLVRGLRPSALEIGAARDRLRTRSVGPVLLSGLTVLPAALSTSCLPRNPTLLSGLLVQLRLLRLVLDVDLLLGHLRLVLLTQGVTGLVEQRSVGLRVLSLRSLGLRLVDNRLRIGHVQRRTEIDLVQLPIGIDEIGDSTRSLVRLRRGRECGIGRLVGSLDALAEELAHASLRVLIEIGHRLVEGCTFERLALGDPGGHVGLVQARIRQRRVGHRLGLDRKSVV